MKAQICALLRIRVKIKIKRRITIRIRRVGDTLGGLEP